MLKKPKVLYIMYDGLTDPLGQSQVLSYLKHLSKDYSFDVIGYEKASSMAEEPNRAEPWLVSIDVCFHTVNMPINKTEYVKEENKPLDKDKHR